MLLNSRVSSTRILRHLLPASVALLVACGGDHGAGPAAPATPTVARVDVQGGPATLEVGATATLSAVPVDDRGAVVAGMRVSWAVTPDSVATIDATGALTGRRPGVAQVVATSAGRTGSATVAVVPAAVAAVDVRLDHAVLFAGETALATAVPRDARGAALDGRRVAWAVDDPRVAAIDTATGVVRAAAPGTARVMATADGRTGSATLVVSPPATALSVLVAGQAVPAGGPPTTGLRIALRPDRTGLRELGAAIGADGVFQLADTLTALADDPATLLVDAVAGGTRTFQPVLVRTTVGTAPRAWRPLLVPARVALPATGRFAGATQAVSLRGAFTAVCATAGDANCNSFFPMAWTSRIALWPDRAFPIPLAFDRAASGGAVISPVDSLEFWTVVRQMEAALGQPLFRPANARDLAAPDASGMSAGAVRVAIDPTLGAGRGWTNWWWGGNGEMTGSVTRVASPALLASPGLVMHELLHALGFHHTCAWPSVMGGYGCPVPQSVTVGDAAAFTLAYQVWRAQITGAPSTGLLEALAGERTFGSGPVALRAPSTPDPLAGRVGPTPRRVRGTIVFGDGAP